MTLRRLATKEIIEPEIGIRIKEDINISKAPFDFNQINDLFDGIVCSIEIVDFRFAHSIDKIGIRNLISTNGASDFWIEGENIMPIDSVNLDNLSVSLEINNNIVEPLELGYQKWENGRLTELMCGAYIYCGLSGEIPENISELTEI